MFSTSNGLLLPREDDDDDPEDVDATLEVPPTSVSSAATLGEVLERDEDSPESTPRADDDDGWSAIVCIPVEEVPDAGKLSFVLVSEYPDCKSGVESGAGVKESTWGSLSS